jgi:integrase
VPSRRLRLQLLLGLRVSEALAAARNEIDLRERMWVLPAARTKSRREHRLPISPLAVDILHDAIERAGQSPWLFPSPTNPGEPMRAKSGSRALLRIRQEIGIDGIATHDLRRTMATRLGDMGVPEEIIARVLNHAPQTVTRRHYNFALHAEPMRRALTAWAEQLQRIVLAGAADGRRSRQASPTDRAISED